MTTFGQAGLAPALFTGLAPYVDPAAPSIVSFAPTFGPVGTVVTLTGIRFTSASQVLLAWQPCSYTVVNDTTITATVPAGAQDGAFTVFVGTRSHTSATAFDVVTTFGASTVTLRWRLEAYPAAQESARRVLIRSSRNALIVRDIVDAESDTYQTATAVTWRLLDGADAIASGSMTATGAQWRGEIVLLEATPLGTDAVLAITVTQGAASWVREYPVYITDVAPAT